MANQTDEGVIKSTLNRFTSGKFKRLFDVESRILPKNLPHFRSAVRSLYPGLSPHTLANFINFSSNNISY